MSLFRHDSIDYRNNPIMTDFVEQVRRGEVKRYTILPAFLAYNYSVDDLTGACRANRLHIYEDHGYKPLTLSQRKQLDAQILAAVKGLPNVQTVKKDRKAAFFHLYAGTLKDTTHYVYTAYIITLRNDAAVSLKDW